MKRCPYCHKAKSDKGNPWTKETLVQHVESAHSKRKPKAHQVVVSLPIEIRPNLHIIK